MKPFLVIITGESGAGKSTALRALEDLDFLAIDNFPVRLLFPFLEELRRGEFTEKLALVMDLRDPSFLTEFPQVPSELKKMGIPFEIIYFSAEPKVLITRFSQTRRPHPLLKECKDLSKAIELEKERLAPFKELATLFMETSQFNVHQLRHEIFKFFGGNKDLNKTLLHLIAFGFKYGIPYEANYLFDARTLPNPYFVPELKPLSGREREVRDFLWQHEQTSEFLERVYHFIRWAIPLHQKEGRRLVTVALGCTGGRHRSPALALMLAERFKDISELEVVLTLRDVERDTY